MGIRCSARRLPFRPIDAGLRRHDEEAVAIQPDNIPL